jgi:hypothetical protein
VIQRIHQAALVETITLSPIFLRLNRAGEAGGAGTDHQYVGVRISGCARVFALRQSFNLFGGEKVRHGLDAAARR